MSSMPSANTKHNSKSWAAVMVALLMLAMITIGGGCTRPSSSDWAQTTPVMQADTTTSGVNLGARD